MNVIDNTPTPTRVTVGDFKPGDVFWSGFHRRYVMLLKLEGMIRPRGVGIGSLPAVTLPDGELYWFTPARTAEPVDAELVIRPSRSEPDTQQYAYLSARVDGGRLAVSKVRTIKLVRALTMSGFTEAKALVDAYTDSGGCWIKLCSAERFQTGKWDIYNDVYVNWADYVTIR